MRIVFVVHYFPPLNSTGGRRVLAFCKYLDRMGHDVTVVTTAKRSYDGPLTEPPPDSCRVVQLGRSSTTGMLNKEGVPSSRTGLTWTLILFRRWLTKLFGQIIDQRLLFAARFARRSLPIEAQSAIRGCDVVVSSCPPWPVHLAAWLVARREGKAWVADYRDQFSGNHLFPGNAVSAAAERAIERMMLRRASAVTVVSGPMNDYYRAFHSSVVTIENGYDPEIIDAARANQVAEIPAPTLRKTLRYLGTISVDRVPRKLFEAVRLLDQIDRDRLVVEFYGEGRLLRDVIDAEFSDLESTLRVLPTVEYRTALGLMLTSDALLQVETSSGSSLSAKGVLTTKLFEYLATRRPIIAEIEPATLIGEVIMTSGLQVVCSTDPHDLARGLRALIAGTVTITPNDVVIDSYSRPAQAQRFAAVLEEARLATQPTPR